MDVIRKIATLHIQAKSYDRIVYSPRPLDSIRDLEIRVARLERQSSPRVTFEREDEEYMNRFYVIAKNEEEDEMGFVSVKLETITYSRDCRDDLKALQSKYPQLHKRKSLILLESRVEEEYQGQF